MTLTEILENGLSHCLNGISARAFVDHCKTKFGWTDLSKDVIMDLGCGKELICGKSILEEFPDVRAIIAIDKNPKAMEMVSSISNDKIHCNFGDIEERSSLQYYENKMTKVVSTYMFHELNDKRSAFENVYKLLKPGGEAAILFVLKSPVYDWIKEMLKNPKWKEICRSSFVDHFCPLEEFGPPDYKEMVQTLGFQIVDCSEGKRPFESELNKAAKKAMYEFLGKFFDVPPESVEEFKEDMFQNFLRACGSNEKGEPCTNLVEMSLLLVKPAEKSSVPKRNTDS